MIYNKVSLADVHVSVVDPLSVRSYPHPLYTYNIAPYTNTITVIYKKGSLADDNVRVVDPLSVRSYTHPLYTYNIALYINTITVMHNKDVH